MARYSIPVAAVFLFCAACPVWSQEGRLQRIRDQVHPPDDAVSAENDAKYSSDKNHDPDGQDTNEWMSDLFVTVIGAAFIIPRQILSDGGGSELFFRRYPYEATYPGYLIANPYNSPELKERWCQDGMPRGWSVRVTLENGNDFDGL